MSVVDIVATALPALLIIASGVGKLAGSQRIVDGLTKYGVARHIRLLGTMEIVFALLWVFPPTMKLGFILGSCYFAGAMAAELAHAALSFAPALPLVVLWVAAFVRDKSIFLPS